MNLASLRDAYGANLQELGYNIPELVVLDADCSKSTRSALFKQSFPGRFFEMSIAEQNMVGVAAGLALTGYIPFVNTFAVFLTGRAYDQIRVSIALARANVKLVGSSSGLSDYGDGPTHQSIEDIGLMRLLPNMTVLVPADAHEAAGAVKAAASYRGPVYIRMGRDNQPLVTPPGKEFHIGRATLLREGTDLTIFTTGIMVARAMRAAELLAEQGLAATVVNVSTIKPLDVDTIMKWSRYTGKVITVEEHSIIGGLGSAICEALSGEKDITITRLGIRDVFGHSAQNYEVLLEAHGLTPANIVATALKLLP